MPYFEPVILFFLLGAIAGLVRSDLKIPGVLYESLSIFLLLAIGLKGGVELARYSLLDVAVPALVVVAVGALIPLAAFPVLRRIGKFSRADAGSIAAHYGSVSVAAILSRCVVLSPVHPRASSEKSSVMCSMNGSTPPTATIIARSRRMLPTTWAFAR